MPITAINRRSPIVLRLSPVSTESRRTWLGHKSRFLVGYFEGSRGLAPGQGMETSSKYTGQVRKGQVPIEHQVEAFAVKEKVSESRLGKFEEVGLYLTNDIVCYQRFIALTQIVIHLQLTFCWFTLVIIPLFK